MRQISVRLLFALAAAILVNLAAVVVASADFANGW